MTRRCLRNFANTSKAMYLGAKVRHMPSDLSHALSLALLEKLASQYLTHMHPPHGIPYNSIDKIIAKAINTGISWLQPDRHQTDKKSL